MRKYIRLIVSLITCPIWIPVGYFICVILAFFMFCAILATLFELLSEDEYVRKTAKENMKDGLSLMAALLIGPFLYVGRWIKTGEAE